MVIEFKKAEEKNQPCDNTECSCRNSKKDILEEISINGSKVKVPETAINRREFIHTGLSFVSWGLLLGVTGVSAVEGIRFFAPAVIFKPPSVFEVGRLKDFASPGPPDTHGVIYVDAAWKKAHRFFIVREPNRLYALSAVCTHLGCTVDWMGGMNIFKCPCHGSQFYSNGKNFAGPAPRPLDWLQIDQKHNGIITVDTAHVFPRIEAEKNGIFIKIKS